MTATNLLNLPQLPSGMSIDIVSNADWRDSLYIPQPGFDPGPISLTGTLASNSTTVSSLSTVVGVAPNMVAVGYGIPVGTTVISVSTNSLVLSADPTINLAGAEFGLLPPPLDLTGISFSATLRPSVTSPQAILQMTTANGMIVNGGAAGTLGLDVPAAVMAGLPFAGLASSGQIACVMDIEATDASGAVVNLCAESGPIPVTVSLAVTR